MKITSTMFIAFLLVGCSSLVPDQNPELKPKNDQPTRVETKNEYPPKVVKAFVDSCKKTAEKPKACPCLAEKIQERFTHEEFMEEEKIIASGKPSKTLLDFMKKAIPECGGRYKN